MSGGGDGPSGTVVVPCADLDEAVERYTALGFALAAIGPADAPTWAELTVPGLRVLVDAGRPAGSPPVVRVTGSEPGSGQGSPPLPDHVELAADEPGLVIPPTVPGLVVEHETAGGWNTGRAGMRYRDLLPERHGGAYIASHIHVPDAGPIPDYVHYHDVAYQLIFCHRGWVRVVYQDQGPPFVMEPGDCVLQPPGIRHRVLESSADLFVTEISCPAVHRTSVEHELDLPTATVDPDRLFGGQRFVRHDSSERPWEPLPVSGFDEQVTAIADATNGLAAVRLVRAGDGVDEVGGPFPLRHDQDFYFLFVVTGGAELAWPDGRTETLTEGSSVAVPAGSDLALHPVQPGTVLLEVTSVAAVPTGSLAG